MTDKIKTFWRSLDGEILVNQRELVLGVALSAFAGIVAGIVLSPKKTVSICSNNGNNNSSAPLPVDLTADEEDPEDEE